MKQRTRYHDFRPHPWHGIPVGPAVPRLVYAFIEITPFDLVKYELDKESGFMIVDRPQLTSSLPPTLYGFVPRTYCGDEVAGLMPGAKSGDYDPLDICVLSERPISRGDLLLKVNVVGGLPMLDDGEADDKIIGVLQGDGLWGSVEDITDIPAVQINRLRHYFSSYKAKPGEAMHTTVGEPYGRAHAETVIHAAMKDYIKEFGEHDLPE